MKLSPQDVQRLAHLARPSSLEEETNRLKSAYGYFELRFCFR